MAQLFLYGSLACIAGRVNYTRRGRIGGPDSRSRRSLGRQRWDSSPSGFGDDQSAPDVRFILIDRLLALEPGVRATASKTFPPDDEVFRDHFPGNPIVPGVLLLEAMAQTAGWLTLATTRFATSPQLVMVKDAKFRKPVRPGVEIRLTARVVSSHRSAFELKVEAHGDDELVASAHVVLNTFDLPVQGESAERFLAWARDTFRAIGGEALIVGDVTEGMTSGATTVGGGGQAAASSGSAPRLSTREAFAEPSGREG